MTYKLQQATGSGSYSDVSITSGSTSKTISSLTTGTSYRFRIVATNAHGSATSNFAELKPFSAPDNISAALTTTATSTKVRFTWVAPDANGDSISSYRVRIKKTDNTFQ